MVQSVLPGSAALDLVDSPDKRACLGRTVFLETRVARALWAPEGQLDCLEWRGILDSAELMEQLGQLEVPDLGDLVGSSECRE